jgi:hypothetical protein
MPPTKKNAKKRLTETERLLQAASGFLSKNKQPTDRLRKKAPSKAPAKTTRKKGGGKKGVKRSSTEAEARKFVGNDRSLTEMAWDNPSWKDKDGNGTESNKETK